MRFIKRVLVFAFLAISASAQLIPSSRTYNWQPGGTVGYQGGVTPSRTVLCDVTKSPFNADPTGTSDCYAAIQAAVLYIATNGNGTNVVYFPAGTYLYSRGLFFDAPNGTFRGSNATLVFTGNELSSFYLNANVNPGTTYAISSGATKGSTSIVLGSSPSGFFAVGNPVTITENTTLMGTSNWPVISVHQQDHIIQQQVLIAGISGTTVTLADPLCFDFTNLPVAIDNGANSGPTNCGIEGITFNCSNGTCSAVILVQNVRDDWITNCSILGPPNYGVHIANSAHIWMAHDTVRFGGSGSNHGGLLADSSGNCLVEDCIFADNLQPGFEFGTGWSANAMFGCFFSNNASGLDIDCHNTHPVMNLFEKNILGNYFIMDGYFGSAGFTTGWRNVILNHGGTPVAEKRWIGYDNWVGNILGDATTSYGGGFYSTNGSTSIFSFGQPNIGNASFSGTAPPWAWNYPSTNFTDAVTSANQQNGIWIAQSNYTAATVLYSNVAIGMGFTNIPTGQPSEWGGVYTLVFQDPVNTNLYYPTNGSPITATAGGLSASITLDEPVTIPSGARMFMGGQQAYQQLQQTNGVFSDFITGNYDFFNNAMTTNGTLGQIAVASSLLYPGGAPPWWCPSLAFQITNPTNGTWTMNPAMQRYLGLTCAAPSGSLLAPFRIR